MAGPNKLPFGAVRVVVSLVLSVLGVAALAKPPLPDEARVVVVVFVAAIAALSARSSLLMIAARRKLLTVDASAPRHRLLLASGPAALLAAIVAAPLVLLPPERARFEVLVAGLLGCAVGVVLATARDRRAKGPRTTTMFRWLVLDTALPAGAVASMFGLCVGFLRWHAKDLVEPGDLARHLAVTTFLYAVLLGLGGFFKAYGERTSGLVVVAADAPSTAPSSETGAPLPAPVTPAASTSSPVEGGASFGTAPREGAPSAMARPEARGPGPVVVGGVLGVALLFVVPHVAPALALDDVLVVKALAGLVVGGGLSLLGAVQGARAADGA